jgi:hypothetical protein
MTKPARSQRPVTRILTLAIAATSLVMGFLAGDAWATPVRPAVPLGSSTVNSLTVNGTTTLNGPVNVTMDATHPGVTIRGHEGSLEQPLRVFDFAGNPIAGVNSAGGMWVAGDNFSVYPPGDVFHASITLHMHGSITIGGPAGPTIYGGPDDPNVVSPCVDQPCAAGDRDLRTNGDTLVYLGGTWVVK